MTSPEFLELGHGPAPPQIVNDPEGQWIATCPSCQAVHNLESLGWTRRGAVSYGKRTSIRCPECGTAQMMSIQHVDRYGRPDQPFGFVLRRVLLIQAIVWMTLGGIFLVVWLCLLRPML